MRKLLLTFFLALLATTALLASNVITYKASSKLPEVTETFASGLHIDAFGVSITSHTFSDGTGTIIFSDEVTSIGRAFLGCTSLTSVTIPNSVTEIGMEAFCECTSLTSISIPSSVKNIKHSAFDECTSLTSINVDAANKHYASIDGVLFNCAKDTLILYPIGNKRSSYTIPNDVKNIGDGAFYNSTFLTSVTISNGVTNIEEDAFYYCTSLISIFISSSVKNIKHSAFLECTSLTSINVDAANKHYASVDGVLFNYAKDTLIQYPIGNKRSSYTIPNSVTSIGQTAFGSCYFLTSISIPNSVKNIENGAFVDCTSLTSVTIPNSVMYIGEKVFISCDALTSITSYATTPPACYYSFTGVDKSIPIYVHVGSVTAYQIADGWKDFTNILAIAAKEVPTTEVVIVADDNTVTITWPTDPSADSYTIEINKDGKVFCTLTFNAQGILTNIAFAPGRGGNNSVNAIEVAGGYEFTITGLNPGTTYAYSVNTKNASGTSIANYTGSFKTTNTTALNELIDGQNSKVASRKMIVNGQLLINKNGKTYNAQGAEVK